MDEESIEEQAAKWGHEAREESQAHRQLATARTAGRHCPWKSDCQESMRERSSSSRSHKMWSVSLDSSLPSRVKVLRTFANALAGAVTSSATRHHEFKPAHPVRLRGTR